MSQTTAAGSETTPFHKAGPQADDAPSGRRWWILAMIGLAQLMVVLDATIVNIALPSAQADLGFSDGNRTWIVTAYSLAFGSLLLLGGRIADLFGRKPAFLVGIGGFAVASAIAGAAPNFEVLVTGRALQGLFGALLAPAALSLLTTTFTDAKERAKAFGIFGAIAGSGAAVGLLLGGVLTEYLNWRWTLYVNLIIAVVAIVGGWLLLERTERDRGAKLDVPGTVLVTAGLFGIVYGFSNAESHDWSSPLSWGFLAAGTALLTVFAWWQTKAAHPLLPLRVLLDRNRGASFAALLVASAGMFGVFLFLTYYLQLTLGFSAIQTGLAFLPMVATLMVSATMSTTFLLSVVGPRIVVPLGMALGAVGLFWLTALGLDSSYVANVLPPLLVTGLGIGLVMAPAMSVGTSGVATEDAGVAGASVNTMQQIGGSIGTPLLNTLAAGAATSYLVGRNPADKLVQAQAAMDSYTTAFMWSAVLFVTGALITVLLFRPGVPTAADPDAAPTVHM
ncbi:MFS transporter [Streptomyces sp. AC512_CC834]|uniref:MFS transporter n=1 Tax=Streptomyces sp. AC512_CC834 TaxID=2823691 RepID=UPI001C27021B|nr:MFS transporter [Streptomyces sp. AC512_CC834]